MHSVSYWTISFMMSKWWLLVLFAGIVTYVAYMSGFPMKYNFVETTCVITNTGIRMADCNGVRCYEGDVCYTYRVKDSTYNTWVNVIKHGAAYSFNQLAISELLRKKYTLGETVKCYYDPLNPDSIYLL